MQRSDLAIRIDKISKLYRIGLKDEMSDSFLKSFLNFVKSPLNNYRKYRALYKFKDLEKDLQSSESPNNTGLLWALKNVSFEVKKGEVLGIIGANGAGKSTLLKVLCKITKPTFGRGEIWGRVSSLLEVGTGFHPELTGKENIYLNGTILGMKKWEIDEKYENIVSFSGVDRFIETPVKRYSSGMKVRLAFSVAAHLEPEILIVDEVLAVGDADFQRKCLNKMEEVGEGGRTVLFVSHNLQALARLCPRAILLEEGEIVDDGPSHKVIGAYLNSGLGTSAAREWKDAEAAPGGDVARLRAVRVVSEQDEIVEYVKIDRPFRVEMEYEVVKPGHVLLPNFHFYNDHGIEAFAAVDLDPNWRLRERPIGRYISSVEIPGNLMAEGLFSVRAALIIQNSKKVQFNEASVVAFTVVDDQTGLTARGDYVGTLSGAMRPLLNWKTTVLGLEYLPGVKESDVNNALIQ